MDSRFDNLRVGLSFTDEARLLASMRLGVMTPERSMSSAVFHSEVEALSDGDRAELSAALARDLVLAPLRPPCHPEWLDEHLAELPGLARAKLGPGGAPEEAGPWLRAAMPVLSARLSRIAEPEVGWLALLSPVSRAEAIREAAEAALARLLRTLGSRERLSITTALGGDGPLDLNALVDRGGASDADAIERPLLRRLGPGLIRATHRARDAEHALERFSTLLLALSHADRFRVEANALAQSLPMRAGRRLVRYLARERTVEDDVAEAGRRLLLRAVRAASQRASTHSLPGAST